MKQVMTKVQVDLTVRDVAALDGGLRSLAEVSRALARGEPAEEVATGGCSSRASFQIADRRPLKSVLGSTGIGTQTRI